MSLHLKNHLALLGTSLKLLTEMEFLKNDAKVAWYTSKSVILQLCQ